MARDRRPVADNPWAPYVPAARAPWNARRVVHLHRRAGFAATWSEIQRDLKDGPAASIERILAGKARRDGVPSDFAAVTDTLARHAGDPDRLKAWWVYRMLFGPDPLTERLVLMWHNHFATSAAKVGMAVRGQNEIFRALARAPFGELLKRVVHDPALLIWLDAQANREGHPNENLGRELLELFTLGIGNYSERDVKEAARALTGWSVDREKFKEDTKLHDAGEKTILGKKGRWNGDDLVCMLLDHPATAQRLAFRICELFMGERAVDSAGVRALAEGLRDRNLNVGWAVETVLCSEAFFAEENLGSRILGPVEYVVGSARALELFDPPPNTLILAEFITNLGQDLFHPPNVGGWPGGRSWISTRSAIGRYNYAVALLGGEYVGLPAAVDVLGRVKRAGFDPATRQNGNLAAVISFYSELLLGGLPSPEWGETVLAGLGPKPAASPENCRHAVALILASPEAQLA